MTEIKMNLPELPEGYVWDLHPEAAAQYGYVAVPEYSLSPNRVFIDYKMMTVEPWITIGNGIGDWGSSVKCNSQDELHALAAAMVWAGMDTGEKE